MQEASILQQPPESSGRSRSTDRQIKAGNDSPQPSNVSQNQIKLEILETPNLKKHEENKLSFVSLLPTFFSVTKRTLYSSNTLSETRVI